MLHILCLLLLVASGASQVSITMYNGAPGGGVQDRSDTEPMAPDTNADGDCEAIKSMHFYHEDWLPYSDWDKATGRQVGAGIDLMKAVCKALDIHCTVSRDEWPHIWEVEEHCDANGNKCTLNEFPGDRLNDDWYDFALAWHKTVRLASAAYTDPLFDPPPHVLVAKKAADGSVPTVHPEGQGESITVQCGWGDIEMIAKEFHLASVLSSEGKCVDGDDAVLMQVYEGTHGSTVGAFQWNHWNLLKDTPMPSGTGKTGKISDFFAPVQDDNGLAEWELMVDPIRLISNKRNRCKIRLFNKGLEMIKANGVYNTVCNTRYGVLARCCQPGSCQVSYNGLDD